MPTIDGSVWVAGTQSTALGERAEGGAGGRGAQQHWEGGGVLAKTKAESANTSPVSFFQTPAPGGGGPHRFTRSAKNGVLLLQADVSCP